TSPANAPSLAEKAGAAPADVAAHDPGLAEEFRQLACWWAGFVLVALCGWVPIIAAILWARSSGLSLLYVLPVSAASLAVFLLLERHFRISRLMSLRVPAGLPWWASAMHLWGLNV